MLQDRFEMLKEALLADVSMSEVLIGADRKSSINLVDGAATTYVLLHCSDWVKLTAEEPYRFRAVFLARLTVISP